MTITLNGKKTSFDQSQTIASILEHLNLTGRPVVVEHNQTALLPRETEITAVNDGDVIEIVQITAGG